MTEAQQNAGSALLVMDIQNGIVSRFSNDPGYLERLGQVIACARQSGIPIIYVVVRFRSGYPEISARNKSFSAIKDGGFPFTEEDEATQIHPAVAPQPGDVVVTKRRVGAFSGSDLEVILRSYSAETLILTGIATSGVVLSTLRAAADLDYRITVISDCCADQDEEVHRVLTTKIFPRQADVVTADEWQASLA